MRAIGLIVVAAGLLAGCTKAESLAGALPGNPFARFGGFSTDDEPSQASAKENIGEPYLVQVASIGGVIIPLPKPAPQITPTEEATPAEQSQKKSKKRKDKKTAKAPAPSPVPVDPNQLAEAKYMTAGLLKPTRKPAPPPPSMLEMAARYKVFRDELRAMSNQRIDTPRKVRAAYKRLSAFDIETLTTGWYAHAAVLAMEIPAFQRQLNKRLSKQSRHDFLKDLSEKPGKTSARIQGPEVTQAVVNAVAEETGLMTGLGASFNERARKFERSRWGLAPELEPQPQPASYDVFESNSGATLWQVAATGPIAKPNAALGKTARPSRSMQPVLSRILALAARISLNAAEGDQRQASDKLIYNKGLEQCLNWAALNMRQCTAAAARPSEWAYCTAKHALQERANCWSWLVSYDTPT